MITSKGAQRPPRLVLRFAVYAAFALLLAGIAIFWVVRNETEKRAKADVAARASRVAQRFGSELSAADLVAPVSAARRKELDEAFAPEIRDDLVRVKLWSRSGTVTYSNDPSLIGMGGIESSDLREVLAGGIAQDISEVNAEGGSGASFDAIETYVPLPVSASGRPAGVLEVYEDYRPITAHVHSVMTPIAVALALALLLLYASLFPILRQVAGALEARNRRLQQQSEELERTIAERKQALSSLREADARYRALVEQLPLVTYVSSIDTPGFSSYVSPQLEPLIGYSPREWLETPDLFWSLLHPEDAERVRREHRNGYRNADSFSTQYRLRTRAGGWVWVEDQVMVIRSQDGEPVQAQGFLVDITARKHTEVALTENEERFRTLVANIPGAVFRCALDSDWTMEFLSDAVEEIVGYPASDFIDNRVRTFASVIHEDDRDELERQVVASVANGRPYTTEYRVVHRDGSVRYVLERGKVVHDVEGEQKLDGAVFDVTERRADEVERERFARELEAQNERLLELDRLKDEFVALVSHELRTPLTSIRGYLELVLDGEAGDLTDEQRQFLGIVERNAHRLLELVGDLLFLAQVEAGKLSLEIGAVDIAAVAAESVETARPLAEEKNITLTLATSPVPSFAGDRARLAQLLDNLVSNAVKFTPEGGRVDVRTSSSRGNAIVEVRDTGMGIPADEQAHVFERFFRTSRATEQAIPGTGLGLAISKAIVQAHGGRITLASSEGEGATFRIAVPIRAVRPAVEAQVEIAL